MPQTRLTIPRLLFLLSFSVVSISHGLIAQTAPPAMQQPTSLHLRWPAQTGVLRFRLQLARDDKFQDIVFDRAVFGNEYVVADLAPGKYYWRVAPAVKETGKFSLPRVVEITGEPRMPTMDVSNPPTTPISGNPGWRTTTGVVSQPVVAHLRTASSYDLVGVNDDGMAYGIDGTNGVALWASRFRPGAKRGEPTGSGGGPVFNPILLDGKDGLENVVVAFDGGVRALDGVTGRELWRSTLGGRAMSGVLTTQGNTKRLLIVQDKQTTLSVLNPADGKLVSEAKLDAAPVTSGAQFPSGGEVAAIFALEGGILDVRNGSGERVRMLKMDTTITTPALVVTAPRAMLLLVGTESGLISITAEDLKPVGRIATEGDAPTGSLAAADLDNDGALEVVILTRTGRIAVIGTTDGRIKWHSSGLTGASGVTFADLNNDGALDVLVPGGDDFARGLSGRDGSIIWRANEEMKTPATPAAPAAPRGLVAARFGEGATAFVVGTDVPRTGLRAVGLPKDSVKSAKQ